MRSTWIQPRLSTCTAEGKPRGRSKEIQTSHDSSFLFGYSMSKAGINYSSIRYTVMI